MSKKCVVVIGAGVSGLTTATLLLKQEKGYHVTIVAKHFPGELTGEYTSPWAGANWRSLITDKRQQEFEKKTLIHFFELAKTKPAETGIMIVDSFDYWDEHKEDFIEPWFSNFCPGYRHLQKEELPDNVEFGITYKTVTINPTVYLDFLLNTFLALGGNIERKEFSHIHDAILPDTDIVINCTGIHSRTLGGVQDANVYAVRGEIVVVELPPTHVTWSFKRYPRGSNEGIFKGPVTYVIPRNNGEVVLGGTYVENDYTTVPDPVIAESIIKRCLATRPDLLPVGQKELKIKRHGVGLRPARKGGIRVEAEWINSILGRDKRILVCHNYGHGGYGYQSSYGAALHLIELMKKPLNSNKTRISKF
ncbi:8719_t:CDS:1 [Ambispora gerdemannii]|uniref:8719_t:CDS:1 n=1 Tax=Ambispora gerdemannii TaxID=144530 RepID=A0A9N9FED3_9GLOM|nr:8719_t:CDS:1 [Ambispora gerdemannii]